MILSMVHFLFSNAETGRNEHVLCHATSKDLCIRMTFIVDRAANDGDIKKCEKKKGNNG